VKLWGAGGGCSGGAGAFVSGNLAVQPGQKLGIIVGRGGDSTFSADGPTYGGGGETPGRSDVLTSPGGGRSAIALVNADNSETELVDAAGGGGGSHETNGNGTIRSGGYGGIDTGGSGDAPYGGTGGTQTSGGLTNGVASGSHLQGGNGRSAGGGGWYGGGAGQENFGPEVEGGGGGGSSYTANLTSSFNQQGNQGNKNGKAQPGGISDPDYTNDVGFGGAPTISVGAGNGCVVISEVPAVQLSLATTHVSGGTATSGSIQLASPSPAGGEYVYLQFKNTTASGATAASGPAYLVVPQGATTASFTVGTIGVDTATSVTVTATLGSATSSQVLEVDPAQVASIVIRPTSVYGGGAVNAVATVMLDGKAGPGGVPVTSSFSSSVAFTDNNNLNVSSGNKSLTFTIAMTLVTVATNVTVTVSTSGASQSAVLQVLPITLQTVTLSSNQVVAGNSLTGTVTISQPAGTGGFVVSISSPTPGVTLPPMVTIPAGQTSVSFTINTSTSVPVNEAAIVSATFNGGSKQADFNLIALHVASVSLSQSTVKGGDTTANVTFTVTLSSPAPTGGLTLQLSSSDPTSAVIASTGTFAAGETSHKFTVSTKVVKSAKSDQITATLNGAVKSAFLTVTP